MTAGNSLTLNLRFAHAKELCRAVGCGKQARFSGEPYGHYGKNIKTSAMWEEGQLTICSLSARP